MIIAVDVDLTVCAIDKLWWQWLNALHHKDHTFPTDDVLDYNLGVFFSDLPDPYAGYDHKDFFRRDGIYDFAEPVEMSVESLLKIKGMGHQVVFVSHVKGNHHKSKYYWLKRNFPFMDAFIATKEKGFVRADMLIDDRYEHLNAFQGLYTNLLFETPYTQFNEPLRGYKKAENWIQVVDYIEKLDYTDLRF